MASPSSTTNHPRLSSFHPQQPSRLSSPIGTGPTISPIKPMDTSQGPLRAFSQQPNLPLLPKPLSPPMPQIQPSKPSQPTRPNYNISLEPISSSIVPQPLVFSSTPQSLQPTTMPLSSAPLVPTPSQMPGMGGILTPSRPTQSPWGNKKPSKNDWEDFDPLA